MKENENNFGCTLKVNLFPVKLGQVTVCIDQQLNHFNLLLICQPTTAANEFNVIMQVVSNKSIPPYNRGFIKRREAGIFPFYSGMFPLLLLIDLYSL